METGIQKVTKDEKIMNALIDATGQSREVISKGLEWGKGNKLTVGELGMNENNQEILGQYNPSTMEIFVDVGYVQKFENAMGDDLDVYKFLIQAIILHEGAHAGAYLSGDSHTWGEPGYRFEKIAFDGHLSDYRSAATALNNMNKRKSIPKRYSYQEKEDEE